MEKVETLARLVALGEAAQRADQLYMDESDPERWDELLDAAHEALRVFREALAENWQALEAANYLPDYAEVIRRGGGL